MQPEEELQLIKDSKNNPDAFGKLYDLYYQKIFNYILRATFDLHASQDITSETFLKVLKNIKKFKITKTGTFQAWVYKIATNEINLYYRRNKHYKFHPTEDMDIYYSQDIPEEEINHALEQLDMQKELKELQHEIALLDEKYRNIIHLRYFEGLQFNEIAKISGINESTLKSHMSRALEKLRNRLPNHEYKSNDQLINRIILLAATFYFFYEIMRPWM